MFSRDDCTDILSCLALCVLRGYFYFIGADPLSSRHPYLPAHLTAAHPSMEAYRMAAAAQLYPHGSRERLEMELDREKRERDARERDLRERELRDMEIQEKLKRDFAGGAAAAAAAGLDRLPPGANPLDPHFLEIQRRLAGIPPTHVPGIYPPTSMSNELLNRAREQERARLERLQEINQLSKSCCGSS